MTINTAVNITRNELIGLEVKVSSACNISQNNIEGLIMDETRNTVAIFHNGKIKQVAKSCSSFIFNLRGTLVMVKGSALIGRPEDRVKKKIKRNW